MLPWNCSTRSPIAGLKPFVVVAFYYWNDLLFEGVLLLGRLAGCRAGTAVRALPRLQPAHPRPSPPAMATVRLPALVVTTFEDLLATTLLQPVHMLMELVLFETRLGFWLLLDLLAYLCLTLATPKLQSEFLHLRLVMSLACVVVTFLLATMRLLAFVVKTIEELPILLATEELHLVPPDLRMFLPLRMSLVLFRLLALIPAVVNRIIDNRMLLFWLHLRLVKPLGSPP